jgi:rhodanese-related sulfurtransferase
MRSLNPRPFSSGLLLWIVWIAAAAVALCICSQGCSSTKPSNRMTATVPADISVEELRGRIKAGKAPILLDVREADERDAATLPGSLHIPLGELPDRLGTLAPEAEIVVFCQSGSRSAEAVKLMREHGISKARSLAGGMEEWLQQNRPRAPSP